MGNFSKEDESTSRRVGFDMGKVLIFTCSREAINKLVKVKINNDVFFIRLMEETFGELYLSYDSWQRKVSGDGSSEASYLSIHNDEVPDSVIYG